MNDQPCINGQPLSCVSTRFMYIIDCIGDINVDLLKIFVWHSYFLYKLEDLFDGFFFVSILVIRNLIFYDVYLMFALITSRILHNDYVRNNVHG